MNLEVNGSSLVDLLSGDAEKALRRLYDDYYSYLCYAVYNILPDHNAAEDIVQEVFFEIWKKRETLSIKTSLRAYLKRAAINRTLNFIRQRRIDFEEEEKAVKIADLVESAQETMEANDLQEKINAAIETLPERCRIVFGMSRFEELTYTEIADKLDISIKTVENQISKALKILRGLLSDHI